MESDIHRSPSEDQKIKNGLTHCGHDVKEIFEAIKVLQTRPEGVYLSFFIQFKLFIYFLICLTLRNIRVSLYLDFNGLYLKFNYNIFFNKLHVSKKCCHTMRTTHVHSSMKVNLVLQ